MPSTATADFSVAYAGQNERDYAAFAEAGNSGRLTARPAPVAAGRWHVGTPACGPGPAAGGPPE
jgi:hypothetical protein